MTLGRTILSISLILSFIIIVFTACSEEQSTHSDHPDHSVHNQRLTYWEDDFEIFALFGVDENSERIDGELFFSRNHQPLDIRDGEVRFMENGSISRQKDLNSTRDGVYPFELTFGNSDEPEFAVTFRTERNTYDIILGSVNRYDGVDADLNEDEVVVLEKPMQWRMSVTSDKAVYHTIPDMVHGTGTVIYNPGHYHEIYSPVDGYIDSGNINVIPASGTAIKSGERLLTISPLLSSENSWTELRLAYRQASQAFERARHLFENDAISLREYQEREREYEVRKAGYDQFLNRNRNGANLDDGGNYLYLNATHNGVIAESFVATGREVKQGDHLFSIYDPAHLWLEVFAYRDELGSLPEITGAEIRTSRNERITLDRSHLALVIRDLRSDATGTRSKVTLSIENHTDALSLNQPVRVRLAGNDSEEVLAVPNEAVFDNESYKVVFVMHSGDQFERRMVQTGSSYGGMTAILDGLESGERIVTKGVYSLHLMTGNVQIDDDHDH